LLFNSWHFAAFMAVLFPLYYLPGAPVQWQVNLLLIGSGIFYAWEDPRLLILLIASSGFSVFATQQVAMLRPSASSEPEQRDFRPGTAKWWLFIGVAINLTALLLFKYASLLSELLPSWLVPDGVAHWTARIPLPVGISFYTFQGISLIVDAYRGDLAPQTKGSLAARGLNRLSSFRDATFYLLFFPQLVAGPIVKAHDFLPQIRRKTLSDIDWVLVRRSLIVGFFLKMIVADNLAEQTVPLSLGTAGIMPIGSLNLASLMYAYSMQIFADFAGYSLIAIGLSALFGYRLSPNFNFPYLATSVTDFWRRWHISLSSWLREYLYIPLGGNRLGDVRTYMNLFIVMFLGGLWHGAAWKYALWGTLHGFFLATERLISRLSSSRDRDAGAVTVAAIIAVLKWFLTFHVVTLLWLTFVMPDLQSIQKCFQSLAFGPIGTLGTPAFALIFYGGLVVMYHAWGYLTEHHHEVSSRLLQSWAEPIAHGLMLFGILTNAGAPRGFIYFQF